MAVEVPLTKGQVALVSERIADEVLRFKWTYHSQGYAYRQVNRGGAVVTIMLHRFVLDLPSGEGQAGRYVDHINRDRLDCRDENLRVCTNSQNQQNSSGRGAQSGYKGVFLFKDRLAKGYARPYRAVIKVGGRYVSLGYHETPEQAAHAYDEAARHYFGEFARTNF